MDFVYQKQSRSERAAKAGVTPSLIAQLILAIFGQNMEIAT